MGVDLTLIPLEHLAQTLDGSLSGYGRTTLQLGRQRLCWAAIDALKPEPLPPGTEIMANVARRPDGEEGYGKLEVTPYGEPYTWIEAGPLVQVLAKFPPQASAAAYLAALSPDTKIILHWH